MVFCCSYCKRRCVNGIGCFSFPRDKRLCDRWLVACGFDLHPENNTLKLKLCSSHFEESSFSLRSSGRKLLKRNAVPTLHLNSRKSLYKKNTATEGYQNLVDVNCDIKVEETSIYSNEIKTEPPDESDVNCDYISDVDITPIIADPLATDTEDMCKPQPAEDVQMQTDTYGNLQLLKNKSKGRHKTICLIQKHRRKNVLQPNNVDNSKRRGSTEDVLEYSEKADMYILGK